MTPAPFQPGTALYLHVPFCASSCDFCSFYQEQPKRGDLDRYLGAIERELALHPPGRVETAFWGGGTPGLLPADDLRRLGHAMTRAAGRPTEWTVELAPSSVRADKLAAL
ncbi:MAG: radical SAM protein, partial [Opitutia bacterium]